MLYFDFLAVIMYYTVFLRHNTLWGFLSVITFYIILTHCVTPFCDIFVHSHIRYYIITYTMIFFDIFIYCDFFVYHNFLWHTVLWFFCQLTYFTLYDIFLRQYSIFWLNSWHFDNILMMTLLDITYPFLWQTIHDFLCHAMSFMTFLWY